MSISRGDDGLEPPAGAAGSGESEAAEPAAPAESLTGAAGPSPGGPSDWSWVKPVEEVRWTPTSPLAYHQLLRGAARYRWWKPLVAVVLGLVYYFTLSMLYTIPFMPALLGSESVDLSDPSSVNSALIDTQNPLGLLLGIGSIVLMLPAVLLAMLSIGLRPTRRLWSVALRIRWRWIGRTVLPAIGALIVINGLGILIEMLFTGDAGMGGASSVQTELDVRAALWSMLIVLLLVPLQSTAEELTYRGLMTQTLGAWFGGVRGENALARFLRGPWPPIGIVSLLFGFSHIYDLWGWLSVVAMAVTLGWLSWRTGGLEAAITIHVLNNFVAFGFMASGVTGETSQSSNTGGPASAISAVIGLALYGWWVDRDFTRRDGIRTRVDLVEEGSPAAGPGEGSARAEESLA